MQLLGKPQQCWLLKISVVQVGCSLSKGVERAVYFLIKLSDVLLDIYYGACLCLFVCLFVYFLCMHILYLIIFVYADSFL